MAKMLAKNPETETTARLQRQAGRHGRSMEEEAREILRDALRDEESPRDGLGTEIAALFHGMGLTEDIPEIRGTLATRNI